MAGGWFDVDKAGLALLLEQRGRSFAVLELVQNAWDTDADEVDVALDRIPGSPYATLVVTDNDPTGFVDLGHAFTLFAESVKKEDPTKRGRFNLGEKMALAIARKALISTTTGTVTFTDDGRRKVDRKRCTQVGSCIELEIRMTDAQLAEVADRMQHLIPPAGCVTYFNGVSLGVWLPVGSFEAKLATVADTKGDGVLRPTTRTTEVKVYDPDVYTPDGDGGWIFEMGIPVVHTGDRYHVDVQQRVPLNLDRDNVTPAYLRAFRAEVLNATASMLTRQESTAAWVSQAIEDKRVERPALAATLNKRYGNNRVVADPNCKESQHKALEAGATLVHGGNESKEAWARIREAGLIPSSSSKYPAPKPLTGGPDAPLCRYVDEINWTHGEREVAALVKRLAPILISREVSVRIANEPRERRFSAWYGSRCLTFNEASLGKRWFAAWRENIGKTVQLICHELAHEYGDHYDEGYRKALERMTGRLVDLLITDPDFFQLEA